MRLINKYTLFVVLCYSFSIGLSGQDYTKSLIIPAVYNHYHLNPFVINPAHTGFENVNRLLFNFRNHWAGFDDSPKAITLGINGSPVKNMGLGGLIYSESYGAASRFVGQANYAYHFSAGENNKMGLGLSGTYNQYKLGNEVITDPLHEGPDAVINESVEGEKFFGADLGFWAEFGKKFKLGITLPQIVLTRLDNKKLDGDKPFNFIGFFGATWDVPEYRVSLEPSILLRKVSDVPFGTDLNILAKMLDDRLYAGFTYSFGPSDSRVSFLGGVRIDRLRVYYSYDQSYQTSKTNNNGSHELSLSFDIMGSRKNTNTKPMNHVEEMNQQ